MPVMVRNYVAVLSNESPDANATQWKGRCYFCPFLK
jgi:hypothetical protein